MKYRVKAFFMVEANSQREAEQDLEETLEHADIPATVRKGSAKEIPQEDNKEAKK